MKKFILAAVVVASLVCAPVMQAEQKTGGFMGGLYGCCFGLRGALAYNDGKDVLAMEWVDALLTCHIWAFIQGWKGTTTADMKKTYPGFF